MPYLDGRILREVLATRGGALSSGARSADAGGAGIGGENSMVAAFRDWAGR
jgi:hypothetical protein